MCTVQAPQEVYTFLRHKSSKKEKAMQDRLSAGKGRLARTVEVLR
jgi:hypothetical protein